MAVPTYRAFDIHILKPAADGTCAVFVHVPAEDQRAEGVFSPPYSEVEITRALSWMEQGLFDTPYVKEFGATLFQTLFTGQVKAVYDNSRQRSNIPLRPRLIIDAPAVARIPWELIYDPDREVFLSLEGPFVRGVSLTEATRPIQVKPPLRILVIDAFPQGVPKVQSQMETAGIRQALSDLIRRRHIVIETLPHATLRKLKDGLREAENPQDPRPYHVLHFIGHGRHDTATGQTMLLFEGEDGQIDEVDAKTLVDNLRPYNLKLVFLNACQSVQSSALDVAQGFAPAFLASGVPAVIGMQATVLDEIAAQFAHDFYAALADNQPVDAALTDARQLVRGTQRRRKADIGIPVCYLRTATGQILEFQPSEQVPLTRETWQPWLRQQMTPRRVGGGFITLLGIISTFLGIYTFVIAPPMPAPTPIPRMSGDFNVAVAEFTVENQDGVPIDTELGADKAKEWFDALGEEFDNPRNSSDFPNHDIWPPELTGKILGEDPEARAEFAKKRAEEINADVIIYGVITLDGSDATVEPEFYVNNAAGFDKSSEIVGQYAFGRKIRFGLENKGFSVNGRLINRIKALSLIVVGMAYYADGNFEQAEEYLRDANEYIEDGEGKDVVYLLIGNTYLLRASERHPDTFLDQAAEYYDKALDTRCGDCSRVRPMLGNLIISQRKALGDLDDVNFPNGIDADELAHVISGYENILSLDSTLTGANIETKANLGLGQAHQFLALKQTIDCRCSVSFEQAIHFLELVVKDYEYGNDTVGELASKAFVSLGWIARFQNNDKAPLLYQNAAVLAAGYDKAEYFYWVGSNYENIQEDILACEAYERCHSFAEEYNQTDNDELCLNAQVALNCSNLGGYNALDYSPEYIYMYNSQGKQ